MSYIKGYNNDFGIKVILYTNADFTGSSVELNYTGIPAKVPDGFINNVKSLRVQSTESFSDDNLSTNNLSSENCLTDSNNYLIMLLFIIGIFFILCKYKM